jgi:hypothetical protein
VVGTISRIAEWVPSVMEPIQHKEIMEVATTLEAAFAMYIIEHPYLIFIVLICICEAIRHGISNMRLFTIETNNNTTNSTTPVVNVEEKSKEENPVIK